jgi:NADH-quinone oxidoreductase subunit A
MIIVNYAFLGALVLGAIAFGLAPIAITGLIAPRKPSRTKAAAYECGVLTAGETWVRFRIQYYVYALLFVAFDVEAVFLYPWAVSYAGLGFYALVEMAIFLGVLAFGLAYAWAKGVLRWA